MPGLSAYLPSLAALGTVMIAAAAITKARPRIRADRAGSRRFLVVAVLTILTQAVHFLEELSGQFETRFPAVFGLPPLDRVVFVVFNVAWLGIWAAAVFGVRRLVTVALWPLWFLGLAALLNLVAHPVLALREDGYFPGLVTALPVGVLGALLLGELIRVTSNITPYRIDERSHP